MDSLALFEIPMLNPNRLHGHSETRRALEAAFQELATINFKLDHEPAESVGRHDMAQPWQH